MADGTYVDACRTVWQKPFWVGDPEADKWQGVMGEALDQRDDELYQARAVRYPEVPRNPEQPQYACPADALGKMAAERGIDQAPGESEASWRSRLRQNWRTWHRAGTQEVVREVAGTLGLTAVRVVRRAELSTPPPVGSLYVQGFATAHQHQFDVLLEKPHPFTERVWGPGAWGDGGTYGSSMTQEQAQYIIRNARRFKEGHDTATYLHVSYVQGRLWGPNKWGDGVWGGSGTVTTGVIGEEHWARRGLL